jgi:indole-3-glycerol phosphate synthase
MADVLKEICQRKAAHVAARKAAVSLSELQAAAEAQPMPRGFLSTLRARVAAGKIGLIAEVKKASPSKGVIREDFDAANLAKLYERAGATCVSVLTDTPYFQGEDADFVAARTSINLPMIRKDFIIDPWQVLESRALGADCILLIMAALSREQAQEIEQTSLGLGMNVLIETHDEAEVELALTHLTSPLIGINNRSLRTLDVDLATTERLSPMIPSDRLVICESGIHTDKDIARIRQAGVHCFLIGESLMRQADVEHATRMLLRADA